MHSEMMNRLLQSVTSTFATDDCCLSAILRFAFVNNVATSLWLYGAWSPYIFEVFGKENRTIGLLAAVCGTCEVTGAVLGGWLGDSLKGGRLRVARASLFVGICAMVLHGAGLVFTSLGVFIVAQASFGLFQGLSVSGVEGVVADRVTSGSRDAIYSRKFLLEMSGPLVGCSLSVVLFLTLGDSWGLGTLTAVNAVGLVVHLGSIVSLLVVLQEGVSHVQSGEAGSNTINTSDENVTAEVVLVSKKRFECLPTLASTRTLPFIVATHDTILIVGSGFTTMYFNLFMIQDYHVSPVQMTLLNGACSLCTSLLVVYLGKTAASVGRVISILFIKLVGVASLFYIAVAMNTTYAPLILVCVAYALRYGAMNCCGGVTRALLMDLVPSTHRARWNAVESLQSASWSGTSIIGGYVADAWGYQTAFLVTLVFHAVACCVLCPGVTVDDRPSALFEPRHSESLPTTLSDFTTTPTEKAPA